MGGIPYYLKSIKKSLSIAQNINTICFQKGGTLCEIKHTDKPFVITKDYALELERKLIIYKEKMRTKKQLVWCLISANGVSTNEFFKKIISNVITLKDLF